MSDKQDVAPDSTAARVALWRALHVEIDPPPHVLQDDIGLKLLAPDKGWRRRGTWTRSSRGPSAPPSWRALASSRTWSQSRPASG
jgi:hypothetical protein